MPRAEFSGASSSSWCATTAARPGDAVRVAEELIARERVNVLMGTFASNVGLAVANLANQRKILFVASEPLTDKIVWENGNRYTFRLRPSTYMQTAMLVPEAAKLKKRRWAIVYPNYEYGQSATASFKKLLKEAQPDVEFVAEQAPALGKIEAGAVVQALAEARPEAIFSSLFAADLQKFVREGNTRGLFKNTPVFNLLAGEPEYLDPLKDETPEGWWVTGYPWGEINTPEHKAFRDAYQKRWKDYPRQGSVVGYTAVYAVAEAIRKAKTAGNREADRSAEGPANADTIRPGHVAQRRPPVHHGRLRRPARKERRQGRNGQLALRGRREVPTLRPGNKSIA